MTSATKLLLVMALTGSASAAPLTKDVASHLAALPLACLRREYPNKLDHLANDGGDIRSPKQLHPAFYGCLDWHSSVHGHWMLVRLLRTQRDLPEAAQIRAALRETLTAKNLEAEAAYFAAPHRESFERTYGWAWLLALATELRGWDDVDGKAWAAAIQPLADAISGKFRAFLPKQTYPIRTGVHPNTAFAMALALDYARAARDKPLEDVLVERAKTYYAADADYPAAWEPSGEDFLSPALEEADLMRRVLPEKEFVRWFQRFLPHGLPASLRQPAVVSDRSDPKLAHLDGLNLSRAWCLRALSRVDKALAPAAALHEQAGLAHVATGDYMGEHWLASFAIYLYGT